VQHRAKFSILGILLFAAIFTCLTSSAHCQSLDPGLNETDKAHLDLLALHTTQKIIDADRTEKVPRVLVIDFFLGSPGVSSSLGTLLADRFSDSLGNSSKKIKVLDRKDLAEYLTNNWTTLEDLSNFNGSLLIGRELGATGIVLGSLYEQNGAIALRIHLSGFGPSKESKSEFGDQDEIAWLTATEQMKDLLSQRGPNYARKPEQMPEVPGPLRAGVVGVGMPTCVHCPDPQYTPAASAAKVQGAVVLGVVVTSEGKAGTIHVLKGAPFGLTAQAIKAVQQWEFKPAQQKDGTPVSVATPIEFTFRLF
jgi:TonB family protein